MNICILCNNTYDIYCEICEPEKYQQHVQINMVDEQLDDSKIIPEVSDNIECKEIEIDLSDVNIDNNINEEMLDNKGVEIIEQPTVDEPPPIIEDTPIVLESNIKPIDFNSDYNIKDNIIIVDNENLKSKDLPTGYYIYLGALDKEVKTLTSEGKKWAEAASEYMKKTTKSIPTDPIVTEKDIDIPTEPIVTEKEIDIPIEPIVTEEEISRIDSNNISKIIKYLDKEDGLINLEDYINNEDIIELLNTKKNSSKKKSSKKKSPKKKSPTKKVANKKVVKEKVVKEEVVKEKDINIRHRYAVH